MLVHLIHNLQAVATCNTLIYHAPHQTKHRWDKPPYFHQGVFSNVVRWLQFEQNVMHATVISACWIPGRMLGLPPSCPASLRIDDQPQHGMQPLHLLPAYFFTLHACWKSE